MIIAINIDEEPKSPLCKHLDCDSSEESESENESGNEAKEGEFECTFCTDYTDDAYKCNSCNNRICCECADYEHGGGRCDNHIGYPWNDDQEESPTDVFCGDCVDICLRCKVSVMCFECHDIREGICYECTKEKADQFICYLCEEVDKEGVLCLCERLFCSKCKNTHMRKCNDESHDFEGLDLVCDWCQVKCSDKGCETCVFCARKDKCTTCFDKKCDDLMSGVEQDDEDEENDSDMSEEY